MSEHPKRQFLSSLSRLPCTPQMSHMVAVLSWNGSNGAIRRLLRSVQSIIISPAKQKDSRKAQCIAVRHVFQ